MFYDIFNSSLLLKGILHYRETIRGIMILPLAEIPFLFLGLAEMIELKKG